MAIKILPSLTEQFNSIVKSSNYVRASSHTIKEMRDTLIEDAFPSDLIGNCPMPDMMVEFPSSIESMLPYLVVSEKTNAPARKDGSKPKEYILILGTTGGADSYWTKWNLGTLAYYSSSYKYDEQTGNYSSEGVISTNDEMRASGIKTVLDVLNYFKGKRVRCTGFKTAHYQKNEAYDKAPRYLMLPRFLSVFVPQIEIIGKGIGYCFSRNTCTGILNKTQDACRTLSIPPVNVDRDGVPYEVSVLDKSAFSNNTFIESLNLKNVDEVRDYALFGCSRLKELVIGNKLKWVGKSAFASCSSIEVVEFSNYGPDYMLDAAFKDCAALTKVVFNNAPHLSKIGAEAFSGCTRLSQIEIPDSVVEIADHAFHDCISLTQIVLPKSVKRIGAGAFKGCINLERVISQNSSIDIAPDAFDGCHKIS